MGMIALMRVQSGKIESRISLYNSRTKINEKMGSIYRVRADQYIHVQQITAGDIVAV